MELVEHKVLQRFGRLLPDALVLVTQQELVEHLVVSQQSVGGTVADDGAVGDEAVLADDGARWSLFTGVDRGGDLGQLLIGGDEVGETLSLVVGQRVHGVEDERLGAGDTVAASPDDMVEDRQQEGLGFARAGTGGDQGGTWAAQRRVETGESFGLVVVWPKTLRHPGELIGGVPRCRGKGHPGTQVRPLENALVRVTQELVEGALSVGVGEGEGGREVVQKGGL